MKSRFLVIALLFFVIGKCYGQLSIGECYAKARANYPSIRQFDLIDKAMQYNLSNANSGYLPQISLNGKASYQSQVTELPISMPGIEALKRDQYSATLDVNQTIWDGGVIHSQKEGIRASSQVERQNLEVELYSLSDRINQIYFGILLFDAQLEQNRLYSQELQRNYDRVDNSVQNGVANKADLDAVKVEQLQTIQTRSTLVHSKTAYVAMLSALIGEQLSSDIKLIAPTEMTVSDTTNRRPELELFAAQKKSFEVQNKQLTSDLMPKFGFYATGGYGRPGLDMLKSDFSAYYIAGVRLSWNISNFYNNKNSRRLVQNNIKAVDVNQKTFIFNSDIEQTTKRSEIDKYRDQLGYDDQIIALRKAVTMSSVSKMTNGTISGIDLMRDVTAQELAEQDKIYHQIQLLLAVYNLKYVTNNF